MNARCLVLKDHLALWLSAQGLKGVGNITITQPQPNLATNLSILLSQDIWLLDHALRHFRPWYRGVDGGLRRKVEGCRKVEGEVFFVKFQTRLCLI